MRTRLRTCSIQNIISEQITCAKIIPLVHSRTAFWNTVQCARTGEWNTPQVNVKRSSDPLWASCAAFGNIEATELFSVQFNGFNIPK